MKKKGKKKGKKGKKKDGAKGIHFYTQIIVVVYVFPLSLGTIFEQVVNLLILPSKTDLLNTP